MINIIWAIVSQYPPPIKKISRDSYILYIPRVSVRPDGPQKNAKKNFFAACPRMLLRRPEQPANLPLAGWKMHSFCLPICWAKSTFQNSQRALTLNLSFITFYKMFHLLLYFSTPFRKPVCHFIYAGIQRLDVLSVRTSERFVPHGKTETLPDVATFLVL